MHNVFECLLTFCNPYFSSYDIQTRRLVTTCALLSIDSLTRRWSQLPPFRRSLLSRLSNIQEHWLLCKVSLPGCWRKFRSIATSMSWYICC